MGTTGFFKRRSLKADDSRRTEAAELTLRQSIFPIALVTVLFFLWGFSYGLLDTLNKHFQKVLDIDRARSAGLQAAYFGYGDTIAAFLIRTNNASVLTLWRLWDTPRGFCVTIRTKPFLSGVFACMLLV